MITLLNYHTPHSTQVQFIWHSDNYLIQKVAKIAFAFLAKNIAIFIRNSSARVNNFFILRNIEPYVPSKPDNSLSFSRDVLPGLVISVLFYSVVSEIYESPGLCKTYGAFDSMPSSSYLAPAILFGYQFHDRVQANWRDIPLSKKIHQAAQAELSSKNTIFTAATLAFTFTAQHLFEMSPGYNFATMLLTKLALNSIVQSTLTETKYFNSSFNDAFSYVYGLSEGTLLFNLIRNCRMGPSQIAPYSVLALLPFMKNLQRY